MDCMKRLFDVWRERVQEWVCRHPIQMIYWETTRNCDLQCIHCGSPKETWDRNQELTKEEVVGVFRRLAQGTDFSEFKFVSLTGGEPFMRVDLLDILSEISILGFNPITIQTNGNYIARHPDVIDRLMNVRVMGIGTNLDGLELTHDSFRNMAGNYKNAIRTIKLVVPLKEKIHSTITTVITHQNVGELEQLRDVVRELNPDRWRFAPFDPIGRGTRAKDLLLRPDDYRRLIEFAKKERLEHIDDKTQTQVELACGGWLGTNLEGYVRPYIWHCVAGINLLGILYDGSIASCSNIPREFVEGNVRNDDILEVWNKRFLKFRSFEWKKTGPCIDCSEWNFCQGGPMHKRLPDGTMLNCIYKTVTEGTCWGEERCEGFSKTQGGS